MLVSDPGVVVVERLRGAQAAEDAPARLLVEVPHGADRRSHYDALRPQLVGDLPEDLHCFFHMNTDVGAWAYGRACAVKLIEDDPTLSVLLLRSEIPRTFVDCNRSPDNECGDLQKGGVTAGIPVYVRDERDRALLLDLHKRYLDVAQAAYEEVCGAGGLALVPHTYGPRTVGIERVDDEIVTQLRWAHEPERYATWPLRAEVDLLTRDGEGKCLAPEGSEERLLAAFEAAGFQAHANGTYFLHPATLGYAWSAKYPGLTLCLEVRRDLLVEEWTPFEEMLPLEAAVGRVADVLVPELARLLEA